MLLAGSTVVKPSTTVESENDGTGVASLINRRSGEMSLALKVGDVFTVGEARKRYVVITESPSLSLG